VLSAAAGDSYSAEGAEQWWIDHISAGNDGYDKKRTWKAIKKRAEELTSGTEEGVALVEEAAAECGIDAAGNSKVTTLEELKQKYVFIKDIKRWFDIECYTQLSISDLQAALENTTVFVQQGEGIKAVRGDMALRKDGARVEYKSLVFVPGEERVVKGALNLWRGWSFNLAALDDSDITYTEIVVADFKRLICTLANNQTFEERLITEMIAFNIQHPGVKLHKALVLASPTTGTGKSLLNEILRELHGTHSAKVTDAELNSAYNDVIAYKTHIAGSELTEGNKRHIVAKLKGIITEDRTCIQAKYDKPIDVSARALWIIESNELDAVWMDHKDRRYIVVAPSTIDEKSFYLRVATYKGCEVAKAAIAKYLLSYDTKSFSPTERAEITKAKLTVIEASYSDLDHYILGKAGDNGPIFYTSNDLRDEYNMLPTTVHKASVTAIGRALNKLGKPKKEDLRIFKGQGPTNLYAVKDAEAWEGRERSEWQVAARAEYRARKAYRSGTAKVLGDE
jgi:hypothetical protein